MDTPKEGDVLEFTNLDKTHWYALVTNIYFTPDDIEYMELVVLVDYEDSPFAYRPGQKLHNPLAETLRWKCEIHDGQ